MNAKSTARTPEREQFEQQLLTHVPDLGGGALKIAADGEYDIPAIESMWQSFQWGQAGREGLLEALRLADELVRTDGHTLTPMCQFNGCTCGGIEAYKVARSNYVRARREALLGTEKERKS